MLHITALMDNKATEHKGLIAEHGLSLYVRYNDRRILFDCGAGPNPLSNAHRLGVDLKQLDAVILSHSHYDHAAGFRNLTENHMGSATLYTGPHFFEPKYAKNGIRYTDLSAGFDQSFLEEYGIGHRVVDGFAEIFPGVYLIGDFPRIYPFEQIPQRFVRRTAQGFVADDFSDEICVAFRIEGGLAVLVGCSHPGILNMMTNVSNRLNLPIKAVFGGTHLVEADEHRIQDTILHLQDMGLSVLGLSHCSGDAAECAISSVPQLQGCHLGVGDCIFFE